MLDPSGRPLLAVGAAGGPKIITQVVLAIVRTLDFRQPLPEALAGRRFHHQWRPDSVAYEKGTDEKLLDGWRARGHKVAEAVAVGRTQAVSRESGGKLVAASDPRSEGKAAGD